MPTATLDHFIDRWAASGAAERANYQLFLAELCTQLDVPSPEPTRPDDAENAYVFERNVHFVEDDGSTTLGRIDLYKRGAFVIEAKQGTDADTAEHQAAEALQPAKAKKSKRRGTAVRGTRAWDDAMVRARGQAERYAKALPSDEGWPPFLIVVDVGHSIELYSEFSRSGRKYVPFPDPQSFRILLADLRRDDIRERLRQVWLDPLALDPSRRTAKVTRELAQRLAELAKLLEKAKHDPEDVARFLMRALFTMFAEDVELIPRGSFKELLAGLRDEPQNFKPAAEDLWRTMNTGGFSPILRKKLLRFNGGLFAECDALPLTRPMLDLLYEAAGADWTDVEPAIFGTLLERALDPVERHKLGAHYTPRAYVERLVLPTVIEPLRDDWEAAYVAAVTSARQGDMPGAQKTVRAFHEKLCKTRVLDPACGSGNFLYVTLEQMKRLEGEVFNALREFGDQQTILFEVDPHQFLGIEVNPRAAAIADLVLWIGYLQWHFRTRGHTALAEPIIKNYHNIERRDAVLAWDRKEAVLDDQLKPVSRWNGRTMKIHPVTGEEVPDESARVLVERYINPRKAEWPKAEFVVGNPPFIGNKRMKAALGDGYVDALRRAIPTVPGSADYVMYWWDTAAAKVVGKEALRFGLITTNSITQPFNREVVANHLDSASGLSIVMAIPDHPWVDTAEGAAVRVSMTVGKRRVGSAIGRLRRVVSEAPDAEGVINVTFSDEHSEIHSDLSTGANPTTVKPLIANSGVAFTGMYPLGQGFVVPPDVEVQACGSDASVEEVLRPYRTARDLTQRCRTARIIDFYPRTQEESRKRFPSLFQWVVDRVKPERDQNPVAERRRNWWLFTRPIPALRKSIVGLERYIVVPRTAKYFSFQFVDSATIVDTTIVAISSNDAFVIGILSSRLHIVWALRTGGVLEDRPRYQHQQTFDPFPFPAATEAQIARVRAIAEQLDKHRKRQQSQHPKLTLTDMYNVLDKLRGGGEMNSKERTIHEQGLVSVLKQIHDDLDAAVFDAYGWPATLTDDEILERLVALNAERAAEEAKGTIRWLRPEFQNPQGAGQKQQALELVDEGVDAASRRVVSSEDEEAATTKRKAKRRDEASKGGNAKRREGESTDGKAKRRDAASTGGKREWPKGREAQAKAVLAALRECDGSVKPEELAQRFSRAHRETIEELLEALATLGQARRSRGGRYAS